MSKEVVFKQSCLIRKNTPGLRGKLSDLCYKIATHQYFEERKRGILCIPALAVGVPDDCTDFNLDEYLKNNPQIIDCGTNENLFLAIAALRDDSDINQWFVNENKSCWWKCPLDEFKQDFETSNEDENLSYKNFHKATIEELINYFKKE